jgi:hypothetical protein
VIFVLYPNISPLENPKLAIVLLSAKSLKTKSSKFSRFFNQSFQPSLKCSPKIKGVDIAYIGSTGLSESPYADEIK